MYNRDPTGVPFEPILACTVQPSPFPYGAVHKQLYQLNDQKQFAWVTIVELGNRAENFLFLKKKEDPEPTNPNARRKNANESCGRLWHKLSCQRVLSTTHDSCKRLLSTTGINDSLTLDNDSCQRLLSTTRANEHDMT